MRQKQKPDREVKTSPLRKIKIVGLKNFSKPLDKPFGVWYNDNVKREEVKSTIKVASDMITLWWM